MRVHHAIAIAVAAALAAPMSMSMQAQAPASPPTSVLKKSAPPVRGTAELGYMQTAKLEGSTIVTTFQVKNLSATNAIVGLQISEFWYDKESQPIQGTGDRQRLKAPLQPLEVATLVLRSPKVPNMAKPQYKFEHNNGTVKPVPQKAIKAGPNT
jgi:hypothetical protein